MRSRASTDSSRAKTSTSADKTSSATPRTSLRSRASTDISRSKLITSTDVNPQVKTKPTKQSTLKCASTASESTPKPNVSNTKVEQAQHRAKVNLAKPPTEARRNSSVSFQPPPRRELLTASASTPKPGVSNTKVEHAQHKVTFSGSCLHYRYNSCCWKQPCRGDVTRLVQTKEKTMYSTLNNE